VHPALTDQNFNDDIVRGLRGRSLDDIVSVRRLNLSRAADPELLRRAAEDGRLFLTHDVDTVPGHVYDMLIRGEVVPKVVIVPAMMPVGRAVDDLEIVLKLSDNFDWATPILYLPL
jgi:predicted nuclease of predicted toxin-antitoxin system